MNMNAILMVDKSNENDQRHNERTNKRRPNRLSRLLLPNYFVSVRTHWAHNKSSSALLLSGQGNRWFSLTQTNLIGWKSPINKYVCCHFWPSNRSSLECVDVGREFHCVIRRQGQFDVLEVILINDSSADGRKWNIFLWFKCQRSQEAIIDCFAYLILSFTRSH